MLVCLPPGSASLLLIDSIARFLFWWSSFDSNFFQRLIFKFIDINSACVCFVHNCISYLLFGLRVCPNLELCCCIPPRNGATYKFSFVQPTSFLNKSFEMQWREEKRIELKFGCVGFDACMIFSMCFSVSSSSSHTTDFAGCPLDCTVDVPLRICFVNVWCFHVVATLATYCGQIKSSHCVFYLFGIYFVT